jgi:hypothetical protein
LSRKGFSCRTKIISAYKKKRNQKELPQEEEKEQNKKHSRKRIIIEHTICKIKKYRIMSDIFRNRFRKYDKFQIW